MMSFEVYAFEAAFTSGHSSVGRGASASPGVAPCSILLLVAIAGSKAVSVLTGSGHEGKAYVIIGPEALTYHEVAEKLSAATQSCYISAPKWS